MIGLIFSLFVVLLIIYIIVINFIVFFRITKIRDQDGHKTSWGFREFYLLQAIFTNKYQDDETCKKLLWQIRILMPIAIVLIIIALALQCINF